MILKSFKKNGRDYKLTAIYKEIPELPEDIMVMTQEGDRFDLLANQFYGNPSLWWYIARANNIKFNPEELINIKGEMGEEVFRMSGNAGKEMANKLQALKKSIKEDGYKTTNIKITVTEDGTAYITEGNHRLAEALQSKRPEIIADVNYLRGGETADGILNPKKLGIQPNIVTD